MSKIITLDRLSGFLTNLKGLFVTKTDANSTYATKEELNSAKTTADDTYETKANAANIYETKKDAATHLTKTEASETYITKDELRIEGKELFVTKTDAESTYETKTDAATHLTKIDAETTYATKTELTTAENNASNTYLSKTDASDTYVNKTDASNTYATKTEVSDTYLSKADVANTYVTKDELGIHGGKSYSIVIDFSLSDPASMITYTDDIDIAPMDTRWFDVLGLKLCVLKNGVVQYYLNPNDVTKKLDGSAADITTLGNDVMLEIPRMGTNCLWLDSNRLKITITTAPNRTGYDYRAFSLHKYNDCDKIYIGRYHAYLNNDRLYSSSGKTPTNLKTLTEYRTYATNRGIGYTDIGICDDILLQCLYLLIVQHFNSQTTIGRGICEASHMHNTGEANTFGWLNTGSPDKTDGITAICCLGIENFWGNIWVWEDGIIRNSDRQFFMAQYADQYNSDATGYEYIAQASSTATGYQGRCAGIPKFIFMPDASTVAASGRGESTYMCDDQWIKETRTVIACFGGRWTTGSRVGAFCRDLGDWVSTAGNTVGSRLCFKKNS